MKFLAFITWLSLITVCSAKLKVATLHPLLGDLARQVGGDQVEVIDLVSTKTDPHTFRPSSKALKKAEGASLYLACGKGMEAYLPKLRSIVGAKAKVVEVGRTIPSLVISSDSSLYACCPQHTVGAIDPHWWQSIENIRRAANVVSKHYAAADPANAAKYKARAKAYRKRLSKLKSWSKRQLATIPSNQRHLATAHAAFGYFCKEFGFKAIPVQGLTKEQSATTQYLQTAIETIRKNKVKAIFPEKLANSKSLKTIAKDAKVKIGSPLIASSHNNIEEMFKHNVTAIVKALK